MARIIRGEGLHRTHIETELMRESLQDKQIELRTSPTTVRVLAPAAIITHLGGRSIIDRGKVALLPLVEEVVACRKQQQLIVGVGAGIRARHTLAIAADLGIPPGGMAALIGSVEEQNVRLVQNVFAVHGGIHFTKEQMLLLPVFLRSGAIPVCTGIPPYRFWEPPPRHGVMPNHGPDCGIFLLAEVLGVKSLIYVKDVDGVYTDDPKKHPQASFIAQGSVSELLKLPDLPIEREVLYMLERAHHLKQFRVINGLVPGLLTRAVNGEAVGTVITKDG
ncbi:MAG: uridine kinase [Cyanobacteria bacterium NC_groundwater_1444_Ag_S-0.65um_54_12]|nr:uridine kinase [Cyanobacteria bacterium NC_groundwater_1444_Ag_S-0.65um_54_12]